MSPLLRRCFFWALAVHLVLVAGAGILAPYLRAAENSDPLRAVDVGLDQPEPVKAPPVSLPDQPRPEQPPIFPKETTDPVPPPQPGVITPNPTTQPASAKPGAPRQVAGASNPGGALNIGSGSAHGDLPGLPTGQTPVGWVPGDDHGKGIGSGSDPGVGTEEPANPAPPAPVDPPKPRRVAVRVCAATRLRPNPYCPEIATEEFVEGSEPAVECSLHKAPPPPPSNPPAPPKPAEEPKYQRAVITRKVEPQYPESARESEIEGTVTLKVSVGADGIPNIVEVQKSSGSRLLDAAAVKAVKQWRWNPALRGDEPVASTVTCPIRFELKE